MVLHPQKHDLARQLGQLSQVRRDAKLYDVWRTDDGAANWVANSTDPLVAFFQTISSMAFAPSDTTCNTYLVGMNNGSVFRFSGTDGTFRLPAQPVEHWCSTRSGT